MQTILLKQYRESILYGISLIIFPYILGVVAYEQNIDKKEGCTVYIVDKIFEYMRIGHINNMFFVFTYMRFNWEQESFHKYAKASNFDYFCVEAFTSLRIIGIIPYNLVPVLSCEWSYREAKLDLGLKFVNKVIWFYTFVRLLTLCFLWLDIKNHLYIQDHETKKKKLKQVRIMDSLKQENFDQKSFDHELSCSICFKEY